MPDDDPDRLIAPADPRPGSARAVHEVLTDGLTTCIVKDAAAAVAAVARVRELDRAACRRVFEERFSVARMAHGYLRIYGSIGQAQRRPRSVA